MQPGIARRAGAAADGAGVARAAVPKALPKWLPKPDGCAASSAAQMTTVKNSP